MSKSHSERTFQQGGVTLHLGDALALYDRWEPPVVIVSDGAYGLSANHGDVPSVADLPDWYEPHIAAWTARATALTTLWFWATEIGWATVHPILSRHGWIYRQSCIWDKGLTHAANHTNTRTLRKLPTVTEVCVQYVRAPEFTQRIGDGLSLQSWLRAEWSRAGLPYREANKACGCGDMARRRYLVNDRHWYCPPPKVFGQLAAYANKHGKPAGRPYFSLDGNRPLRASEWNRVTQESGGDWTRQRGKFFCPAGLTNVWRLNPVRGAARMKLQGETAHPNQKPLALMERIIRLSSEPGDLVWEPFGGLFTVALAAARLKRRCVSAEIRQGVFRVGTQRLKNELAG